MKGKVIEGKYGKQIFAEGRYYRISKDFGDLEANREIEFESSTSEYNGKEYLWANPIKTKVAPKADAPAESDKGFAEFLYNALKEYLGK